ncbi:hypothetical protein THAOC_19142, partial [Thalassiosira oceanica]
MYPAGSARAPRPRRVRGPTRAPGTLGNQPQTEEASGHERQMECNPIRSMSGPRRMASTQSYAGDKSEVGRRSPALDRGGRGEKSSERYPAVTHVRRFAAKVLRNSFEGKCTMLRRALSVARAPGPRVVSTACCPRSLWKHQPSILVDPSFAIGGSLSETSTSLKVFQLRWRADNYRGDYSSRGKRGRGATKRQRAAVDFRSCQGVEQLVDLAYCKLDSMDNRALAAFWSALPRMLHKRGDRDPNIEEKLSEILGCSLDEIRGFSSRDLAQTSLGLAKTVVSLTKGNRRYSREDPRRILQELLAVNEAQQYLFGSVEIAALPILGEFDARYLSNLIYSFGLVKYNPTFEDKTKLFDALASTAIDKLAVFNGQDISNMLLAFVYVDSKNSMLFQKTGEALLKLYLGDFTEQALANILWSFAKSGEADPELFQALGDHIVERILDDFRPQHLSNIVWSYATGGVSHPGLFKKIGDHVAGLKSLDPFDPQSLSNTAWAFATAGV